MCFLLLWLQETWRSRIGGPKVVYQVEVVTGLLQEVQRIDANTNGTLCYSCWMCPSNVGSVHSFVFICQNFSHVTCHIHWCWNVELTQYVTVTWRCWIEWNGTVMLVSCVLMAGSQWLRSKLIMSSYSRLIKKKEVLHALIQRLFGMISMLHSRPWIMRWVLLVICLHSLHVPFII
jgi:hypothetical protein